jgi:hypothetical protein
MNTRELKSLFEKHQDEYLKFERVVTKRSRRADLHAFILLDELFPAEDYTLRDIIGCAEHEAVYLSIDVDELAAVVTEDQVVELLRCGVRYDSSLRLLYLKV